MADMDALAILIVDDHEPMRAMLCKMLERAGCADVRDASRAEEALALLGERPADLIVLDRNMPGMDGLAMAARVRAEAHLAHARIVLLSGNAVDDAPGVDAVLTKPIAPRDLLEALNRLLAD